MPLFDVYPLYDVTPVKAQDVYIWDDRGKRYLDLYGGHAVISIGHAHPRYVKALEDQLHAISFYSNAVVNPLQEELAERLEVRSGCEGYQLFLCNSGAEANENALKLASFVTGRSRVIAFKNAFHGRTSAAVAATDNPKIVAPINAQQQVTFLDFEDIEGIERELAKGDACAVILETIQGVGGLDMPSKAFYHRLATACKDHGAMLIADEVQCGFGRTGNFFAFQHYGITPDIIPMAKGMGNGFPVGGVLIHPSIKPNYGMLGTTFGGNHLACRAVLAVLEVLENEGLLAHVANMEEYFREQVKQLPTMVKIKGRGLMLGLEFDFEVATLRKRLIHEKHIFTGGSSNRNLIRILPPLTVQRNHIDLFFKALNELIKNSAP